MALSERDQLRAFSLWLRTGQWPAGPAAPDVECKFNPYHDPRNGQFTFAPGGPRSLSRAVASDRRKKNSRRYRIDEIREAANRLKRF